MKAMFAAGSHPPGQFSPRGRAVAQGDGYTVSGQYSFGSGSGHADWIGGGALEVVDGQPRMLAPGRPAIRVFFVPRDRVEFAGNWDVIGLVGTGSYDYIVPEQIVDGGFTFDLLGDRPLRGGPIYRLGVLGLALIGHAGFALGVGRRAIEEVTLIARTKQRMGAASRIGDRERFQFELGRFDAARARSVVGIRLLARRRSARAGRRIAPAILRRPKPHLRDTRRRRRGEVRDSFEGNRPTHIERAWAMLRDITRRHAPSRRDVSRARGQYLSKAIRARLPSSGQSSDQMAADLSSSPSGIRNKNSDHSSRVVDSPCWLCSDKRSRTA